MKEKNGHGELCSGSEQLENLRKERSGFELAAALNDLVSEKQHELGPAILEQALKEAEELLEGREDLESRRLLLSVHKRLTTLCYNQSRLEEQILFSGKWLNVSLELNMLESACEALNMQGVAYRYLQRYKETFVAYQRGISLARRIGYRKLEAKMLYNTGEILSVFESTMADALDHLEKAEKIYLETDNMRGLSYVLTLKGACAKAEGNLEEARRFYSRAIELRREHGMPFEVVRSTVSYAICLEGSKRLKSKAAILREALEQTERFHIVVDIIDYSAHLSETLMKMQKYGESEEYLSRSMQLLEGVSGYDGTRRDVWLQSYELSKATGNWKEAVTALEKVMELNQELSRADIERELKAFGAKRELDYIETEKALLQEKNQELLDVNNFLKAAMDRVTSLRSMLPICTGCGKVRNDSGYWQELHSLLEDTSFMSVSHSLCSSCSRKLYGDAHE